MNVLLASLVVAAKRGGDYFLLIARPFRVIIAADNPDKVGAIRGGDFAAHLELHSVAGTRLNTIGIACDCQHRSGSRFSRKDEFLASHVFPAQAKDVALRFFEAGVK